MLSELAQLAALPWSRQSFAHWPPLARVAFIGASEQAVASFVRAIPPAWLCERVGLATVLHGPLFALGANGLSRTLPGCLKGR